MADVQLERGYVRVANRLDEAITCADFTVTQMKIVRAIIRLTWGWRQRSVVVSASDLAQRCGLKDSGGFRRDLRLLVTHGVLFEVEKGHGRTPSAYSINKNFEQWGVYAVPLAKLEALFGDKLPSLDSPPPSGQATDTEPDDDSTPPPSRIRENVPAPSGHTTEAPENLSASMESGLRLHGVTLDGRKSNNGETLQRPKDMKDSSTPLEEKAPLAEASSERATEMLPPAAAGPAAATAAANATANRLSEPHRDMLVRLSTAVYHAVCARWGEPTRPIPFGTGSQLAADLIAAGVAWSTVEPAIKRVCEKKSGGAPTSLEYFRAAIFEAHEAAAEKAIIANAQHRPAGGAQAVAALLGRETPGDRDRKAEEALRDEYDHARREAAEAWATDPANAGAVRIISAKAQLELGASVYGNYGEAALASAIRLRCAERAGFPDFESWKNSRERGENPESVPKQGVTLSAAE